MWQLSHGDWWSERRLRGCRTQTEFQTLPPLEAPKQQNQNKVTSKGQQGSMVYQMDNAAR